MNRRRFLVGAAVVPLLPLALRRAIAGKRESSSKVEKIHKSEDEWRAELTEEEFNVLREEGTESPGSSPLNDEHRTGTFVCAGCDLALFKSEWKFESGTGWPSFYRAIPGAVATKTDYKIGVPRTEY